MNLGRAPLASENILVYLILVQKMITKRNKNIISEHTFLKLKIRQPKCERKKETSVIDFDFCSYSVLLQLKFPEKLCTQTQIEQLSIMLNDTNREE